MSLTEAEFRDQVVTELREIKENQNVIAEQIKEVNIILHGSEKLGVPALHKQVKELWIAYDRAKWALGGLGLTNLGFIIVWILAQISKAIP